MSLIDWGYTKESIDDIKRQLEEEEE